MLTVGQIAGRCLQTNAAYVAELTAAMVSSRSPVQVAQEAVRLHLAAPVLGEAERDAAPACSGAASAQRRRTLQYFRSM